MPLVDVVEVQEQIPTDLENSTLRAMIDREEAEIDRRFGTVATARTEQFDNVQSENVWTRFPIDSGQTITVVQSNDNFVTSDTLTSTDYLVVADEGRITRLSSSLSLLTESPVHTVRFKRDVRVTYTPQDDKLERKAVVIELVRLALSRTALLKESIGQGDYTYQSPASWEEMREEIIRRLERFPSAGGL